MKVGSIKENLKIEQRIAVTPEIIKKYKSLDLNIILPKDMENIWVFLIRNLLMKEQKYWIMMKKY